MFENYSFGDLLSNIYKKRILNLIAFLLLSIALVCPLVLQTINKKTITYILKSLIYFFINLLKL